MKFYFKIILNIYNYLDKNKGRTREGKLKRMTIILGIAFVIVTVALNIVYPLV